MFRLFLTRILLKLLRVPINKINERKIRTFLWTALPQQGFQDYITRRDMTILQQLGMGATRDEYLSLLGQRIEVGLLLSQAKESYKRVEKDKNQKIESVKKTSKNEKQILKEESK